MPVRKPSSAAAPRPRFDTARIVADMTLRGWSQSDLAKRAKIAPETVSNFLRGEVQTAKTAGRIARALGHTIKRYFTHVEVPHADD